jgi:WD40 repeat protein
MEGYSMKKILLSLSIAVMLLSNFQQSFAMKQDEEKKITEKNTEVTKTKQEAKIFEKLSDLADDMQKHNYTDLTLDFVLGDDFNKKIKEHNKLEKLLTNDIVGNVLKIRLNKPFVPTKEELATIEQTKNENDFPAPDKEIEKLTEKSDWLSIKFLSWLFPEQVDKFYQSFGKKLWAFAANNVREEFVAWRIYEKYLANWDKYYESQTLAGHTRQIECIAVLPNGNIVTGSWDDTAKIWDSNSGQLLQTLAGPSDYTDTIDCIAVLPNGNIVTGSVPNKAKVWNLTNGQLLQTLVGPNDYIDWIICMAVLPNGNIVKRSSDNTAKIWDSTTGQCLQTLTGHTRDIECIAVLPNGNIVTGSRDNTAKIWDQTTGQCLQTLTDHTGWISCMAVLPNGNIVTSSWDNTAKIWNTTTGNLLQTLAGHTRDIECIAVLPNGNIVTGSRDNTAKIWDPTTGQCLQTLTGHTRDIKCIAILPNGNIVTGSDDNTAKIWDSNSGQLLQTLAGPNDHTDWISCIAVLPSGNIVTGSEDGTAKIWDPKIPFIPNVMSMALVAKLIDLKKNNQTIKLHQEWQEIFDKLPVSKDIKDDLKTVLE